MFSNQDVDYSLNRPCRCLSAVAPPSKKSSPSNKKHSALDDDDDDDDGIGGGGGGASDDYNGWDDDDDYLDASSSLASHGFLVGSAIPSVSKLGNNDGNDGDGDGNGNGHDDYDDDDGGIIEEEDEERTNRIHLLRYREESHELARESSWAHPTGEVWAMACHPTRPDWVATCGGGAALSADDDDDGEGEIKSRDGVPLTRFRTALWRIPELGDVDEGEGDDGDGDDGCGFSDDGTSRMRTQSAGSALTSSSSKLEHVVTIPHGENSNSSPSISGWERRVGQILWSPLLSPSQSSGDAMYDLAEAASSAEGGGGNLLTVGWDARSPISLWDVSSLSEAREVWSTHHGGGGGVASSRGGRRGGGRLAGLSAMHTALPRRASWDPHDAHCILATAGVDVVAYDTRSPASSAGLGAIRSAHRYGVADVCHNPLQSDVVVTAGMDGVVKFWDLRMHLSGGGMGAVSSGGGSGPSTSPPPPLLKAVRGGHSHWTTRASYNPFHDQLVLSGGTDGVANLWRISSCSSAPLLDLEEDDEGGMGGGSFDDGDGDAEEGGVDDDGGGNGGREEEYGHDGWAVEEKDNPQTPKSDDDDDDNEYGEEDKTESSSPKGESNAQDVRVTRFECSDVAVDLAWSAGDPWVYATLSYDGAMVVHHVPSKEKYKILL